MTPRRLLVLIRALPAGGALHASMNKAQATQRADLFRERREAALRRAEATGG